LQNRLSYSAAVYDIEWHNVQEARPLRRYPLPSAANVGNAYSRGVELEATASITQHLAAKLVHYDETKLTSFDFVFSQNVTVPLPPPGGPLPGHAKNSVGSAGIRPPCNRGEAELRYALDSHYQSKCLSSISENVAGRARYTMLMAASVSHLSWLATGLRRQHPLTHSVSTQLQTRHFGVSYPSRGRAAHVRPQPRVFVQEQ